MEPGPQRRLLARRPATPVSAADHGSDLRLRGGQRRGAGTRTEFASQLDAARARGAQVEPRLRPRPAGVPQARQPQGARLPEGTGRRDHPVRRQPRPHRAAGGARPAPVQGTRPGRTVRPRGVSADRRAALSAHAARFRFLLVPPLQGRRGAALARGAPGAGGPAGARAVRRLDELLPRPGRALAHRHGRQDAPAARGKGSPGLHRAAALVRRQGRAGEARAARRPPRLGAQPAPVDARAVRARVRRRDDARAGAGVGTLLPAAGAGLGRRPRGRAGARALAGDHRQGAPAGERRHAERRLRRRGILPGAGRGDRPGRRGRDGARAAALHRDRRVRRNRRRRRGAACGRRAACAELQHRGGARRTPVPQGLPPPAPRHQPRIRGRPLSHRCRRVPALRAGRRSARLHRRRRFGHGARAAAGLRLERGRRLDLHARIPRSSFRGRARYRRRRGR